MSRTAAMTALLLLMAPTAALADGDAALLGRWKTQKQGATVEIHRCGAALCGRVVDGLPLRANPDQRDIRNRKASLRDRKIMNLRVLESFTGGPGQWTGGPVYDPDTGDGAPTGSITLVSQDVIRLKGCLGPICRAQTWTRAR
ncbi:MAG: DUF2147 domain-containing protein [Pseudomonadota bacterium]